MTSNRLININKKGLEFTFAWLFAIIAGAVIIFIAIYATTQFIGTSKDASNAKITGEVGSILESVETSLEEGKQIKIEFPDETRIYNRCDDFGNFGRQLLSVSVRSGIGNEFQRSENEQAFFDKYIFSEELVQGKEVNIFVKPFEMPYKIASLAYIYSENYCFVNPSGDIEDEIRGLNLKNVNISESVGGCARESIKVCFESAGCDVNVNLEEQSVTKNRIKVFYEGDSLMYGAIFAEPEIYLCQVTRLMKRTGELAHVYSLKAEFLEGKGCTTGLDNKMKIYASNLANVESDKDDIKAIGIESTEIRRSNEKLSCKLF